MLLSPKHNDFGNNIHPSSFDSFIRLQHNDHPILQAAEPKEMRIYTSSAQNYYTFYYTSFLLAILRALVSSLVHQPFLIR